MERTNLSDKEIIRRQKDKINGLIKYKKEQKEWHDKIHFPLLVEANIRFEFIVSKGLVDEYREFMKNHKYNSCIHEK